MLAIDGVSLNLQNVTRSFGHRPVFAPVSFEVSKGLSVVVTGPNGSGKSTLLRMIAGLLPPSGGELKVSVGGSELDPVARRQHLGYVAPDLVLYRELSGVEKLRFFGRVGGDRESTRLKSSHSPISYAVFCLEKKQKHPSAIPSLPLYTVT